MPGQDIELRILTEAFDGCSRDRRLSIDLSGRRKLRKFVELFVEGQEFVSANSLLPQCLFAGVSFGSPPPQAGVARLRVASHSTSLLPRSIAFSWHLLHQPSRNQALLLRRERGHKRIQRGRVVRAQIALQNSNEQFGARGLRQGRRQFCSRINARAVFISQCEKTKHRNVVRQRRSRLNPAPLHSGQPRPAVASIRAFRNSEAGTPSRALTLLTTSPRMNGSWT